MDARGDRGVRTIGEGREVRIARTIAEVGRVGGEHGLVPTMGALHAGHRTLLNAARRENAYVTLSIFVNPLQFGPHEDLSRYPRPIENDLALAESAGVDQVFLPSVQEMYPEEPTRIVVPGRLTERWEGASRPGHFDGVATVVARLFGIVGPRRAYFGRKDLQQCRVVAKMVRDLALAVDLRIEPTFREPDGLAFSSRNAYLSPEERKSAPELYAVLVECAERIVGGEGIENVLAAAAVRLENGGFRPDYLAYVDESDLRPLDTFAPNSSLIVAAKLGTTRLIDNLRVAPPQ